MAGSENSMSDDLFSSIKERPDYLGWGYLYERTFIFHCRGQKGLSRADADLLHFAAINGWSSEDLFVFCNSKDGRHYGEAHADGRVRQAQASLQYFNDNWMLVARKDRGITYEESVAA